MDHTRDTELIHKRDRHYKKHKKTADNSQQRKFKELKKTIQKELRRAYWRYIESIVTPSEESDERSSMKKFWTYIKHKRTESSGISVLRSDGLLHSDPVKQATILNTQFQSAFSEKSEINAEEFKNKCGMQGSYPTAEDIHITEIGIHKLLSKLNPHKAAGPDELKPRVLKELADCIAPILTIIFNKSLDSGEVPTDWKTARVSPIYKKGDRHKAENYRPISLTCICCKLLEHVVTSNIMKHADTFNIMYPLQHGFRQRRSCETQLIEFIEDVTTNLSSGKQTDTLIMDFSKAFDKVSHSLLLHKLHHYGIRGKTNRWIKSFLSERTQSVVVDGESSPSVDVQSGVPQGSVIGPCLFLFYINDMPLGIESTVRLFADDTIAYLTITSKADHNTLQQDLDKLAQWEVTWKMVFHPDKCQVLTISRKNVTSYYQYTLHGHVLEHVTSAKYLGINITSDLRWGEHIAKVCNKANRTIGFLRRNLNISSTEVKENAYKTLVQDSRTRLSLDPSLNMEAQFGTPIF